MATKSQRNVPSLSSIGIDIGKDVFHLVGFDPDGTIAIRRKVKPAMYCWHGSLPERPFCQSDIAPFGV